MTGGLTRRIAKIRQLQTAGPHITLETGEFAAGTGLQDRMKAQAVAAAIATVKPDLVARTPAEDAFGDDLLPQLETLLNDRLQRGGDPISKHGIRALALEPGDEPKIEQILVSREPTVLIYGGDRTAAAKVASGTKAPVVVIYRSPDEATAQPKRFGKNWTISPGTHGKVVLSFTYKNGNWADFRVHRLGPDVADDARASRLYRQYLTRVSQSDLFERMARTPAQGFAGSDACQSCHASIYDHWQRTKHASAMKTLETEGHDRDPDCVSCHAVGTGAADGYMTRLQSKAFGHVGCESCHGPSAAHVKLPSEKTPFRATDSCLSCHTRQNSPNFNFLTYWKKIQHPPVENSGKRK